jgi:hypothetical protein
MTADLILDQKQVTEVITGVMPFQDLMAFGETISGASVSVAVSAGTDPDPDLILDGSPNWTSYAGLSVAQNFQNGISGNIYFITYTVTTTLSNTYEKTTYLAVINTTDQF